MTVLYLVRHAETAPPPDGSDPSDPILRDAGLVRARALAHVLADEPVGTVFSTDYRRTRETAGPVADAHDLEITIYDARDLEAFAHRLREMGGRHVVVGHSNTTPALAEALGGDPGPPIEEPWEYDRVYVVTLDAAGEVRTLRLRYGAPSAAGDADPAAERPLHPAGTSVPR